MSSISQIADTVKAGPGTSKVISVAGAMIIIGAILSFVGFKSDAAGDTGFAISWLWGMSFIFICCMGCFFFVVLHHITGAVWSVVVRRIPELFMKQMWVVFILFMMYIVFSTYGTDHPLYHWIHPPADDAILEAKSGWLNWNSFILRGIIGLFALMALSFKFVSSSINQDNKRPCVQTTLRLRKLSLWAMPCFALCITFLGIDWIKSLEPHWFSTMYGVYIFGGAVVTGMSIIVLVTIWLRSSGRMGENIVTNEHLYSLGAFMFAFTVFWTYIAFSQFMLIWYGNISEETIYYQMRGWAMGSKDTNQGWYYLTCGLVILRFIIPFLMLLSRKAKMCPKMLVTAAIIIIIGEMVDLYWMIMPTLFPEAPRLPIWLLGPLLLASGLVLVGVGKMIAKEKMVPVGDPLFEKSVNFHL